MRQAPNWPLLCVEDLYLNYKLGVRYLKIKKLNIQHVGAKIAQLNHTGHQRLCYNPCKILNI